MAGKTAILSVKIIGDSTSAVKSMRETESAGQDFSKSFDKMAGAAAIGGAAAGAALTSAYLGAVDVAAGNKKLADSLGLDPAAAEVAGAASGNLYAAGFGDSLETVNTAVGSVIGNIDGMRDASTAALEDISGKVMNVADTFEQDLGATTTAVGQLMRTGMAPDAETALDIITKGLQANTRSGDDLLDTFTEYPAIFERLGLDGELATGLISQGMDAGARSTDLVADALKEFQIRSTDATEASAAGFEALGLNAADMTAQMAAGGEGAAAGLDQVLDGLRNMTDPVAQNAAAVALFGTQAEDLGGALYALDPSSAVAALGEVAGAAEGLGATEAESAITSLQRSVTTAFTEMAAQAIPTITPILEKMKEFAPILAPLTVAIGLLSAAILLISGIQKAYAAVQAVQTAVQWASNAAWLASPITWIILAIIAAIALVIAIVVLVIRNWDEIAAVGARVWQGILDWLASVGEAMNLGPIIDNVKNAFSDMGALAGRIWDNMTSGIDDVIGAISRAIGWFGKLFGSQDKAAAKGAAVNTSASARMATEAPASYSRMAYAEPDQTATMSLSRTASTAFASTSMAPQLASLGVRTPTIAQAPPTVNIRLTVNGAIDKQGTASTIVDVLTKKLRTEGRIAARGESWLP